MDPDAAHTVLYGALATCTAGFFFGGTYSIVKRQPLVHALNVSINGGLAGLTFFAFREYVAGPILVNTIPWQTYKRRREAIQAAATAGGAVPIPTGLTFSEARTHKLLDTALAGSATGGILNFWKRGAAGVGPGAVTAGIICTAVQLLWNELGVMRVKFVSRVRQHRSEMAPVQVHSRTFSEKLMDGLGVLLPVRKLSDEEYMRKLLKERAEVERRLEQVHAELENTTEQKNDA